MAGIGFTLRKIVGRSYMSYALQAAFTGVFIVAGPWILSIINLTIITASPDIEGGLENLYGPLVYGFAFFFLGNAPLHYLFTRVSADLVYIRQERQVMGALLVFLVPVGLLGLVIALGILRFADPSGSIFDPTFRLGFLLFALGLNGSWLVLIVVSLLRWYVRLLGAFLVSMAMSIGLIFLLGQQPSIGQLMLVYGISNFLLTLALVGLCLWEYPPKMVFDLENRIRETLTQFWRLILTGWFYAAGLWSEKILYWIAYGEPQGRTRVYLFAPYDFAVYLGNLTLIAGMVYFVIYAETNFSIYLRKFLSALDHRPYTDIQASMVRLKRTVFSEIRTITLVQGIMVAILLGVTAYLTRLFPQLVPSIWIMNLGIVFFQVVLICILNFLFYVNQFRKAFGCAVFFFLGTCTLTILELFFRSAYIPTLPLGTGAILGSAISVALGLVLLEKSFSHLDRLLYVHRN